MDRGSKLRRVGRRNPAQRWGAGVSLQDLWRTHGISLRLVCCVCAETRFCGDHLHYLWRVRRASSRWGRRGAGQSMDQQGRRSSGALHRDLPKLCVHEVGDPYWRHLHVLQVHCAARGHGDRNCGRRHWAFFQGESESGLEKYGLVRGYEHRYFRLGCGLVRGVVGV